MKKILFILLLFSGLLNAQSSFKDAEHEFTPACNNGRSIIMARYWFHINAIDTVWKTYYFDSTGKSYTPTGAVTLGFCFKPDTGALAMFQRIIDTLSSINQKEAINNIKNDTIISKLDNLTKKTYFDSSWYSTLRKIQINIADSLRTYNYKYDSINIVRNDSIIALLKGDTSNIDKYGNTFQVQDCSGANVGAPQNVLKTVVLNKVIASICNTSDFKDTSSLAYLRAIQKNVADSLSPFRYQYIDTTNSKLSQLLAKQFADTTINSVIRKLQINVQDSLRTYNVSFDTSNARLLRLLSTKYFDTTINSVIRQIQINIADSLKTFNYSYDIKNNTQNDTIIAKLTQIATKTNVDSTLIKSSSLYQVLDCKDSAVGSPQTVLKTIVMNKMSANICNVSEIAGAIKTDTSNLALIRVTNSKLDSLILKQTTQTYKALLKNISGTTHTFNASNCQDISLGCCWVGQISVTDSYGNVTTFTDGSGINFNMFKGLSGSVTINATGATGAIITGSCLN